MGDDTSVRPANLVSYKDSSTTIEQQLADEATRLTASYQAFQRSSGVTVANPGLLSALGSLQADLVQTRRLVELVHDAVLQADVSSADGVTTVPDAVISSTMASLAGQRGWDLDAIESTGATITIPAPTLGTIPQDSGYVDDPVCTATGHFLEDEVDLVLPDRLAHLAWPRRYSSRQLDAGAHGRGWFSWADARCEIGDGLAVVVCPDGRHLSFVVADDEPEWRTAGIDATLRTEDGGHVLTFGPRSSEGHEIWTFDGDGRIRSATGARRGTTSFEHRDGRLVGVHHAGGRHLELAWTDDRIGEVRCSDGRTVRYRYDERGDLIAVERALGGRTYEPREDGRIVRVVDADGVVLCVNEFDDAGRVVSQLAPTGRVSRFRYEPGLKTTVLDGGDEVVAVYVHDRLGRVVHFLAQGGASLWRRFDDDGVVVAQRAQDGSSFVASGTAGPGGLMEVRHRDGRIETFRYDDLGRLAETSVDGGEPTRIHYEGSSFQPSHVEGALDWSLDLRWRDDGALLSTTDADGVTVDFTVDAEGLPEAITVPDLSTIRIRRDCSGSPDRIVLPDGETASATFDDAGRPLVVESATGAVSRFEYSPAGRLTAVVGATGSRVEIAYGSDGAVAAVRDPLGQVVTYETDTDGRATALIDELGASWHFDYSPLGVLTSITDPNESTWTTELDRSHRVIGVEDPLGRHTRLDYDDAGRVTIVDGLQEHWQATFGDGPLPEAVTTAPGGTTVVRRDARSRLAAVVDADGVEQRYDWTPANRLAAVRTDDWSVELTYGSRGELQAARVVDHTGAPAEPTVREWTYDVDWRGNVVSTRTPEGRVTATSHDAAGRPFERRQGAASTSTRYDAAGQVVGLLAADGSDTTIERDPAGRVVGVTRPGGGRSSYELDGADRVRAETDPLGGQLLTSYDGAGNLRSRTDQLGRTSTYDRRADGSLATTTQPDGTAIAYGYDDLGRLATIGADGATLLSHEYGADRLLSAIVDHAHERRIEQRHTPTGALLAEQDSDGLDVQWLREGGRVVARLGSGLPEARWTHRPDGVDTVVGGRTLGVVTDGDRLVTDVTLETPGGHQHLHLHRDGNGHVVGASAPDGMDVEIVRDDAGRIVEVRRDERVAVAYAYDDAGRLSSSTTDGRTTSWTYDLAGRLVAEREGEAVRTFEYDAAHQLRVVDGPDGRVELDYDACGRRVAERSGDRTRTYEWDAIGRLTAIVDHGRRVEVDIDGFGLLRRAGDSEVRWDRSGPAPVPASVDGRPVVCIGRRIVADGDDLLADGLLGPIDGSPWGRVSAEPVVQTDVGIPGGLGFAGLVWLGARVYDPATRQLLTPDPLRGAVESAAGAFPYAYADLDPVNRCDPFGTSGQPISLDDFAEMKDRATSVQWANIVEAGLVVGGAIAIGALAATGVGLPLLIAAGATMGAVSGAVPSIMRGDPTSAVLTNTAFGALAGGISAGLGPRIPPGAVLSLTQMGTGQAVRTVATEAVKGGATSAGLQTVREGYDGLGLPGGDGSFDGGQIVTAGATGLVADGITQGTFLVGTGGRPPLHGPTLTPPHPEPSPLIIPEAPSLQLPSLPDGFTSSPSGLVYRDGPAIITPPAPAGHVMSPGGLWVPGAR